MNRLKLLTMATLMALTLTACDEGETPPVDVPPPPTPVGTISGTVTIDGTGATGITATLSSGATTATGAGGTFSFAGVEAGSYTVTISGYPADAAFPSATQAATIASDGQTVQLNFAGEYIRSSSVVGSVVAADPMMMGSDSNGDILRPDMLDGITVTLEGEHTMAEPQSTMEGGFAFTGLRAGSYTVEISGFPEDVQFDEVSMTVEVGVGDVGMADFKGAYIRTAAVEGRVIIEGEGLAGVTVTLTGGPGNDSYTKLTGDNGEYAFTELRPGDYQINISGYDADDYEFASSSHDVSVDLGETETVSFTGVLLRTSGISGRVSGGGMGLPDITVTLSGAADTTTTTDASGQYAFSGLAAGDYTVSIAVESAAYVFGSMSSDVTVGDDESKIANFEGAHAETASVSGMLFIDELDNNDMHDAGEAPLAKAGIPVALVGPGVNDQRLSATNAQGQFTFSDLRAGPYQLIVPIDATVAAALAAADLAYGGPATGYAFDLAVGEPKTQAVPFNITHTTVNFTVSLKSGEDTGDALPGATVTLYSDAAGETKVGGDETGEDGSVAIKVNRAGTSGNMVHAGVSADGYHVADGLTPVPWNPQIPATVGANANDIVNLNAEVSVSGATITTEYGGGVELAGWALNVMMAGADGDMVAVTGAPEALGDDGSVSFESAVEFADLPMSYYFAVAEDQDDEMDGGESITSDTVAYEHDGLSLAGGDVAIEARYKTQTLKVYVHHERDQVMGYTGNVLGGDVRVSGMLDVEVRYVAANGRSRAFTKEEWDAEENTKDAKGVLTFSQVPADMNVIATAKAAGDANVILLGDDRLATYEDFEDNGVTGSAFGDLGGFHHTVALCPLPVSNATVQDPGDCASFAFVNAYTVDGQVWKNQVKMDDDVGFGDAKVVGVPGTEVTMDPVAGKNLAGDPDSFTAAEKDDKDTKDIDETKQFDFGQMADGVYTVGVPSGWVATDGARAKLPSEFLLEDELDADDHLNIDVTPTTGFLYGVVSHSGGLAAEGVTVDVNGESAVTDESGRYIVEGFSKRSPPRMPVLVTASGTGYTTKKDSTSAFAANKPTQNDIKITSIGDIATFSGNVRQSGGGALSGVTITVDPAGLLLNPNAKSSSSKKENDIYKTGDDGVYTVQVQAVGGSGSVTLKASMKGRSFSPEMGHSVSAVADANISGLDFTAFDHATISGRVLNKADGSPEPGVEITATRVGDSSPADSDISRSTGTYSLSVPYGAYIIAGDDQSGYVLEFKDGIDRVNVAPGQRLAFGDIKATVSEAGRPPRFTSSASFTVAAGEREIGTVKATDPDTDNKDADITFGVVSGADAEMMAISTTGVLSWAQTTLPTLHATVAANNVYKATVEARSGELTAIQNITVTVTASGDLVVKLVLTPATVSEGGTSVVTATLESAASNPFYVVVAAPSVAEPSAYATLSTNKTLFIAEGATRSSGASVTITAANDNVYNGEQIVWVTGTPSGDDMTVTRAKLTITDNDVAFGKVQLILTPSSIPESQGDGNANVSTVTARLVGGETFDDDITITVTAAPVEAITDDGAVGTLTILTGSRSSTLLANGDAKTTDHELTITAEGDALDAGNTVVTVSGSVTVGADDALDDDHSSQPDDVSLIILDDDAKPGAPRELKASVGSGVDDDGGAVGATVTVTWKAPSSPGSVNGDEPTIMYERRFEEASVIGREGWDTADGTADSDGVFTMTLPVFATDSEFRGRTVTVQIRARTTAGESSHVSTTVDIPAGSGS